MEKHIPGFYEKVIKRFLDILCVVFVLILFGWLYLILALAVRIGLGSPILFCQERPGKDGKIFKLYKFRTMRNANDAKGNPLPDKERMTKFGNFLRTASLDELPEVFNILKGDMSLVGPRPLLVRYLDRYNERQAHRHDVRPGLTGYAQVHGRNAISWEEKFELDLYYIEHLSFLTDIKVLLDTVGAVLNHKGISSGTSVTMEEFMGTPAETEKEN